MACGLLIVHNAFWQDCRKGLETKGGRLFIPKNDLTRTEQGVCPGGGGDAGLGYYNHNLAKNYRIKY